MKQGSIFGLIMSCASTSKVNTILEAVMHQYGEVLIGTSDTDDITIIGTVECKHQKRNTELQKDGDWNVKDIWIKES